MSDTPNTPNEIIGFKELQALAEQAGQRASAWDVFTKQIEAKIRANQLHRQPQEEIDNLLASGEVLTSTDLYFNDALAITEVTREQDSFSLGWDITYNCLAASAGDFAPYNPPNDRDYYATREQALIAAVAWLNDKMQVAYEILMGNAPNEDGIETRCPGCGLPFIVDEDGDIVDSFPGDRED